MWQSRRDVMFKEYVCREVTRRDRMRNERD